MTDDQGRSAPEDCARRFLRAYWAGDLQAALAECRDTAIMELPPSVPIPSPAPMGECLQRIFTTVYPRFENNRFDVEIRRIVADGNTVIVEYQAKGILRTGSRFLCSYLAVLETEAGRLRTFRPYTDTKYITDVLLGSRGAIE